LTAFKLSHPNSAERCVFWATVNNNVAKTMKISLNLTNPKHFPELMLFFGMILVFVGSGVDAVTRDPTLTNDGWIVVVTAVFLWMLKNLKRR
jgi:hypothetical protein